MNIEQQNNEDLELFKETLKNFFVTTQISVGLYNIEHKMMLEFVRNEEEEVLCHSLSKESLQDAFMQLIEKATCKEEYIFLTDELKLTYAMIGLWHDKTCHHYIIMGPINHGPISNKEYMQELSKSQLTIPQRAKLYQYFYMIHKKSTLALRCTCKLLMSAINSIANPFEAYVIDSIDMRNTSSDYMNFQEDNSYKSLMNMLEEIVYYSKIGDREKIQRLFSKQTDMTYRQIIKIEHDQGSIEVNRIIVVWMLVMFSIPMFESNLSKDWVMDRLSYFLDAIIKCKNETNLTIIADQIMLEFLGNTSKMLNTQYPELLVTALQYIHESYRDGVTLKEIAEKVHMNEKYFSQYFNKHMGQSYSEYMNTLKVDKAKELLTYTQMDLSSIALAVGFKNQSYFSTVFKKYTGVTPAKYKMSLSKEKT